MFTVTADGTTYKVTFSHFNKPGYKRVTRCEIIEPSDDEERPIIYTDFAYCSRRDNFKRDTGRKLALARTLRYFSRESRTLFWEAYFKVRNGKKE